MGEEKLAALVFELANARRTLEYKALDERARNREIERERYAKSKEELEYQSLAETMQVLLQGVSQGELPESTLRGYPADAMMQFYQQNQRLIKLEEYLHQMEQTGHTEHYKRDYDRLQQQQDKSGQD